MTLEQQLASPEPPERIDALAIDFLGLTRTIGPHRPVAQFSWNRPDGATLTYHRWRDEDGEWFYPLDEVRRRHGMRPDARCDTCKAVDAAYCGLCGDAVMQSLKPARAREDQP